MSSHCSPRIAIANCEQWYIIFCIFSIFLNKHETWNLNLVPTPLPPSPQLLPGSATATTKRGTALLEVKTIIFLHNLRETDKSLVPSGGNALVLNNRKGRRDVSCKSERYAQRTNQKRPIPRGTMRWFGALYKTAQIWQAVRAVSNRFWSSSFKLLSTKIKRI